MQGLLCPNLISISNRITSVKFRCFTRNYKQHQSGPSLSERVNDLSPVPRLCVIVITGRLFKVAKGLFTTS